MTWTEPKVDWTSSDEPTDNDFNNICDNLLHLYERKVPSGAILMWAGALAVVPSGWALCDGNNGTPDLRDRFILGAAIGEEPGATGGSHTKMLTTTELPGHTHTFTAASAGAHTHTGTTGAQSVSHTHNFTTGSAGSHTHTGTTGTTGSGQAFDIRPKYYKLAFIMKL